MSFPTDEQIESLVDRFTSTLNEWDDIEYVIGVRGEDGNWLMSVRGSKESQVVVAHSLLERVVDTMCTKDEDEDEDEDEPEFDTGCTYIDEDERQ